MASQRKKPQVRIVACPRCGGESVFAPTNTYRPFCSERCKSVDFGAWASESFRVPDELPPDGKPLDQKLQ